MAGFLFNVHLVEAKSCLNEKQQHFVLFNNCMPLNRSKDKNAHEQFKMGFIWPTTSSFY